jgi:hypothetical protein
LLANQHGIDRYSRLQSVDTPLDSTADGSRFLLIFDSQWTADRIAVPSSETDEGFEARESQLFARVL